MILRPIGTLTGSVALVWIALYTRYLFFMHRRGYDDGSLGIITILAVIMWLVGMIYLIYVHKRYGTSYQYPRPKADAQEARRFLARAFIFRLSLMLVFMVFAMLYILWKMRR